MFILFYGNATKKEVKRVSERELKWEFFYDGCNELTSIEFYYQESKKVFRMVDVRGSDSVALFCLQKRRRERETSCCILMTLNSTMN